jgi:hypothetical protein
MTNHTSVPHHRVEAAIHATARDLALSNGVSLSQVAESGLLRYIEQHPQVTSGSNIVSTPTLPQTVIKALVNMREIGDTQLNGALASLHGAGWSYATLAKPIGLTRQAVHLRVTKAAPGWPLSSSVPEGPSKGSRGASTRSSRFDWAVWVDKTVYAQASSTAKQRGDLMRDVMESILSDYVSGAFAVETADVSPAISNEKKANNR